MRKRRTRARSFLVLLTLAAFAVRALSLDTQPLWRDEVDALRFATAPLQTVLARFTQQGWNGPLYSLLLRWWIALTGSSEYAMRFFSLFFSVLSVPLAYVVGCRLLDRQTGAFAALLVTTSPYLAWFGQETKMYTLVSALVLLAIYALRRAVEGHGKKWWVVQIVATSVAFYCHILAALLVPVQALLVLTWRPRARRWWLGALISLACLTLPYLPLAAWQVPLAFKVRVTGFPRHTLGEMAQILLSKWSTGYWGISGWGWPWAVWLLGLLATWGLLAFLVRVVAGSRRGTQMPSVVVEGKRRVAILCWLAAPLFAIWFVSLRQPIFTDRYLIWTVPAFYLLVGLGLAAFWRYGIMGRTVAVVLTCTILIVNGANLWRQATITAKSDFRAAAAYVANYRAPVEPAAPSSTPSVPPAFKLYLPVALKESGSFNTLIIFQIPYGRFTFDYYFPVQEYDWLDGLYTNHRHADGDFVMSEAEVDRRMREAVKEYEFVWLVVTEEPMWDERGLVRTWMDENARLQTAKQFTHIGVYRYVR